jgi:hypothetical protein
MPTIRQIVLGLVLAAGIFSPGQVLADRAPSPEERSRIEATLGFGWRPGAGRPVTFRRPPTAGSCPAAALYAFDLIELNGEDLRARPFLDHKAALARHLRDMETGILLNEHVAEDGPTVFAHACRLSCRGHRVEAGRWHLSIWSVSGLDQDSESGQHCCAAGA